MTETLEQLAARRVSEKRAQAEAEVEALRAELQQVKDRNAELERALSFYADEDDVEEVLSWYRRAALEGTDQ